MKKTIGFSLALIGSLCGCASGIAANDQQIDKDSNQTKALVVGQKLSDNFKTVYQRTGDFWHWRDIAKKLHAEGTYEEAIKAMEQGFEAAYGAFEKGIAARQIAQSYEALHDYELAANFYEASGKYSMNPKLTDELNAKAAQMRDLFKTRGYQDMKTPPNLNIPAAQNEASETGRPPQ